MKNKIVLIGTGNVGISYAFSLINQDINIDELVIIDINEKKVEGQVLDLKNSVSSLEKKIHIKKGNYSDCKNAKIVCITAGVSPGNIKTSRLEDLEKANIIIKNITNKIKETNFKGILLIASNPLDIITYITLKELKYNPKKIIGTGTSLDTARLKTIICEKIDVNIKDVNGYVLGEHGDSQFVNWSSLKVENKNISEYLNEKEKNKIEETVKKIGYEIANKQGYTCYAIASCLSNITKVILNNEEVLIPISTYIPKYEVCISTPCIINKDGVKESNIMELDNNELEKFSNSVNVLKNAINTIKK